MQNNNIVDIYQLLREKKSESILNEIKSFINIKFDDLCLKSKNIYYISNEYQDFLFKLILSFSKQWSFVFECNRNLYSQISDAFESLITKSLNRKIFHKISTEYAHNNFNINFEVLIKKYSFITFQHLGIDTPIDHFQLSEEIKNFVDICQLKSTLEKSQCLVNLCNYLSLNYPKQSLMMMLVYVLLSSSIPFILENIKFIKMFRNKVVISSTEDFYIEQMTSAIDLIDHLDTNNSFLTINHVQFDNYCDEYNKKQLSSYFIINKSINDDDDKKSKEQRKEEVNNSLINLLNKVFFFGSASSKTNKGLTDNNDTNSITNKVKVNESLLSIPIEQLQNNYCLLDFKEMSYAKIEELYKDFKILVKIIDSYKTTI